MQFPTRKSRWIVAPLIVVTGILLAGVVISRKRAAEDPVFRGKRLSEILADARRAEMISSGQMSLSERDLAQSTAMMALKELGPQAMPLLGAWLRERDSEFKQRARRILNRFGFGAPDFLAVRSDFALRWLSFIPEHALDIAPELIANLAVYTEMERMEINMLLQRIFAAANREDRQRVCTICLKDVPTLFRIAGDRRNVMASETDQIIKTILSNASLNDSQRELFLREIMAQVENGNSPWSADRLADRLDPDYLRRNELLLKSGVPSRQTSAAEFFRASPMNAERIVPLLKSCLLSTNKNVQTLSARALGAYSGLATNALADLKQLARASSGDVTMAASNAIAAIERIQ